eukprot:2927753-Rhodomonas_salina.1
MAVPSGLTASGSYKWMLCHLMGLGPHSHGQFADKCQGLSYSKRGQFYGRFREYWRMKMWLGEPDFDDPDLVQAPTHIAYTPQLILNEPSFTEGCRYQHFFYAGEDLLLLIHEEVLRKIAGGQVLTCTHPAYGVCVCFERSHPLDREDSWQVLLLSYWDCPGFDSNSDRDVFNFVTVPQFMEHVWAQTVSFSTEPDVWETLSHHELNLMLMPGHWQHTKPV